MEIIYEDGSVKDLIGLLEDDLSKTYDLKALARLPEPSRGRRYREVLYSTFIRLGYLSASVILEFKDGRVKSYVFLGRVIPTPTTNNYLDMPVYTEGFLIEREKDTIIFRHFNPYIYRNARMMFEKIKEIGDKYRVSDLEVYLERIGEYLEYDNL